MEAVADDVVRYVAERTPERFHRSRAVVRGLKGPFGTGKTVACCWDLVKIAQMQRVINGKRRARFAAIRNTYPELESTTIKTWMDWFGDCTRLVHGHPITGHVEMDGPDGIAVEFEIIFLSCDRPEDVKKIKGLECTAIWLNEASELAKAIFDMACARIWRYPAKRDGGSEYCSVIMDTNPPDDDHWWYRLAEDRDEATIRESERAMKEFGGKDLPFMEFFHQPPALLESKRPDGTWSYKPNPVAENVKNQELGYAYWMNMLPGKTRDWIKVFVLGQYGVVSDGKPVFPEYNDEIHCWKTELKPIIGLPLRFGWDFGLTPALVIAQMTPFGQLRVIDEICASSVGLRPFARDAVKPYLLQAYKDFKLPDEMIGRGDPAGTKRWEGDDEALTCIQELADLGLPAEPAYTNDYVARREAVAGFMSGMLSDGRPTFLLSPKCKILRKGFRGRYELQRIQVGGQVSELDQRHRDEPLKNAYSHPQDALQYIALELDFKIRDAYRRKVKPHRRQHGSRAAGDSTAGY